MQRLDGGCSLCRRALCVFAIVVVCFRTMVQVRGYLMIKLVFQVSAFLWVV